MTPSSTRPGWPDEASIRGLPAAARATLAARIATALGPDFAAEPDLAGSERLPAVRHRATDLTFVYVPGGAFVMGLSDLDERDLSAALDAADEEARDALDALRATATPAHDVRIAPFLCARAPLTQADASQLAPGCADAAAPYWQFGPFDVRLPLVLRPGETAAACARAAMRLLSEAEWEWVARALGATRFVADDPEGAARSVGRRPVHVAAPPPATNALGVYGLALGEWVADAWHPRYDGAPATSRAWDPRPAPEMYRGSGARTYPWQAPWEVIGCHAAFRAKAGPGFASMCVRFAVDLPDSGR